MQKRIKVVLDKMLTDTDRLWRELFKIRGIEEANAYLKNCLKLYEIYDCATDRVFEKHFLNFCESEFGCPGDSDELSKKQADAYSRVFKYVFTGVDRVQDCLERIPRLHNTIEDAERHALLLRIRELLESFSFTKITPSQRSEICLVTDKIIDIIGD